MESVYTSLLEKYQSYLHSRLFSALEEDAELAKVQDISLNSKPLNVGIVGGGMAGLYSAMLLQKHVPDVEVTIFEASDRVGGRVYTHKFSKEPHQYFDGGAMRFPKTTSHSPVFTLIDHLNNQFPEDKMELIDFKYSCPEGNRVFVNNTKQNDGRIMSTKYAAKHCTELGFPKEADINDDDNAGTLLLEALAKFGDALQSDFETALLKFSSTSVREYMSEELGWSFQKIDYIEVMTSGTNVFQLGIIDVYFQRVNDYKELKWVAIEGGFSKLPELCAEAVKNNGGQVFLNAKVESIVPSKNSKVVSLGYSLPNSNTLTHKTFDKVIVTLPPPHVRLILERPYFGEELEHALRAAYFIPASKMGLQFHSRFWEHTDLSSPPSFGGSSTTDLPSRSIVYPSYGMGEDGKGVLIIHNLNDDSQQWNLMPKVEKIKQGLQDIQSLYPEVDLAREYAGGETPKSESFLVKAACTDWQCGFTLYYCGQFLSFYQSMLKPQGNIFFAGAHLSPTKIWIMSALESARTAVKLLTKKYGTSDIDYL